MRHGRLTLQALRQFLGISFKGSVPKPALRGLKMLLLQLILLVKKRKYSKI